MSMTLHYKQAPRIMHYLNVRWLHTFGRFSPSKISTLGVKHWLHELFSCGRDKIAQAAICIFCWVIWTYRNSFAHDKEFQLTSVLWSPCSSSGCDEDSS